MASDLQKDLARHNGHFGGPPTKDIIRIRRIYRDAATKLVARQQVEAVKFLIWVMNNPSYPIGTRVQCALELLNRGEMPAKSAAYVGIGSMDDLESTFGTPKLFILGKFGSHAEVLNGGEADVPRPEAGPDVAP